MAQALRPVNVHNRVRSSRHEVDSDEPPLVAGHQVDSEAIAQDAVGVLALHSDPAAPGIGLKQVLAGNVAREPTCLLV